MVGVAPGTENQDFTMDTPWWSPCVAKLANGRPVFGWAFGPSSWAKAVGPIADKCDGVDFEISGQQVTAKDLSTCGIQGAEYDVPGMDGMDVMGWGWTVSMGFP